MARARRGPTPPLIQILAREPYRFDSRQALRVVEAYQRTHGGATVAFRSSLSLAFPISDIESIDVPTSAATRPVITVSFLGLGGATGPLPAPFTEYLAAAVRRRETSGRDFLDVFNHRLVTAAMDMAKLYRPALQPGPPQDSNLARQCYALLGLGTPAILATIPRLAPTLLPLAALIDQRPLSAHAIERAVTTLTETSVRVVPFVGAWLRLDPEQRTAIGRTGRNRTLGRDATLGGRVWDQSAAIIVELGPMSARAAERWLPAASPRHPGRHAELADLIGFLVQKEVSVGVRLLVETAQVRPSRLSRSRSLRLGWNAWLTRDATARHAAPRLGRSARLAGRIGRGGDDGERRVGTPLGGTHLPAITTVFLPPRDRRADPLA